MCAAIGTEGPRRAGGVARAARADEAVASLLLPVDIPLWARQTDRCALAPGFSFAPVSVGFHCVASSVRAGQSQTVVALSVPTITM